MGICYHGHYHAVDFPQDDFPLGIELFARVVLYFEVEVCADVAHLLGGGHGGFGDAGVARWGDVWLFFGHGGGEEQC